MKTRAIGTAAPRAFPAPELTEADATGKADDFERLSYDAKIASLVVHPAYVALSPEDRAHANDIIERARSSPKRDYFLRKLKLLLDTKPKSSASSTSVLEAMLRKAAAAHDAATPHDEGQEERLANSRDRVWKTVVSPLGSTFLVDGRHASNVVARVKVRLFTSELDRQQAKTREDTFAFTAKLAKLLSALVLVLAALFSPWLLLCLAAVGPAPWVARAFATKPSPKQPDLRPLLRKIEDDIEKRVALPGFHVDLVFVDEGGDDVFDMRVDPTQWTDAGNWVGDDWACGHEMMHLLGLDDEYDYIEVHAGNGAMTISQRLLWFLVGMAHPVPADGKENLMGGGKRLVDRQVCQVAQLPEVSCLAQRVSLREPIAIARSARPPR